MVRRARPEIEHSPAVRSELITFFGCRSPGPLTHLADARAMLSDAVRAARLTELRRGGGYHKFEGGGHGLTAFVLLSQSHVALHTWPETGVAAVEFLSYEDHPLNPAVKVLAAALRPSFVTRKQVGGLSFVEEYGEDAALWLRASRILVSERTRFQSLHLFDTPRLGKVLALDGKVQCTEWDEFCYHELLVHPALHAHPRPRRIVILGGGDLGAAREVLKHPGAQVTVVELDEAVLRASTAHLPWARGVSADPRVEIVVGDGVEFLQRTPHPVDVVLVDVTDPTPSTGISEGLFSTEFYRTCRRVLGRGGVFGSQTGSPLYYGAQRRRFLADMARTFPHQYSYLVPVPTYPFGHWGFTLAWGGDPRLRFRPRSIRTRLYSSELVRAGGVLARSMSASGLELTTSTARYSRGAHGPARDRASVPGSARRVALIH